MWNWGTKVDLIKKKKKLQFFETIANVYESCTDTAVFLHPYIEHVFRSYSSIASELRLRRRHPS